MPCYYPRAAVRLQQVNPETGKRIIRVLKTIYHYAAWYRNDDEISVPCQQCHGCRLEKSREWATRLMQETKSHDSSCFLTLTYDDANEPKYRSLKKSDLQTFWKDLRGRLAYWGLPKIKYFAVGEYGEKNQRPHYHAIVFGQDFGISPGSQPPKGYDTTLQRPSRSGGRQFTSALVEDLWALGLHRISEVNFETAAYVARYSLKKITGAAARSHYGKRIPEFLTSSNGLAKAFFEENSQDIYPADQVVIPGRGVFIPPKYFDRLLEKVDPILYAQIKEERRKNRKQRHYYDALCELYRKKEVKELTVEATLKRTL